MLITLEKMPILPIVARSGQGVDSILELLKDDDLSTAQPLKIPYDHTVDSNQLCGHMEFLMVVQ